MEVNSINLANGEAWVTPIGILFQERYYSCRLALKEQWFVRAQKEGLWPLDILYDAEYKEPGLIYIASHEFSEDCLCFAITRSENDQKRVEAYQLRLQQLKTERLQRN